jgi:DHA1 family bicyclomycin/chloramphenicol resistance-like MFS transporter
MKTSAWMATLLGFLSAVGPVSTDMYLPAFPAIEHSLGTAPGTAQVTLATWFLGLAVGQMTQGSLSDRFGRRAPLLVATAIYAAASAGCAMSHALVTLSAWRAVAAFGGAASMVLPRAIVRDRSDGLAAARLMSRLMLISGVVPILAPTFGGLMLQVTSWRAIFWLAAGYGVLSCMLVWRFLPDTLPPALRVGLHPASMARRYVSILRERSFITHALAGGFAMFGLFAYLGGSPAVYEEIYHLRPALFGSLFGLCAAGFIGASQVNPLILPRLGPERVLRWATRIYLGATLCLFLLTLFRHVPWWGIALPIWVCMVAMGFVFPNAVVGSLARHAAHAGSASALMGTLQYILGAISGVMVGLADDGTVRPMALLMVLGAACAVVADSLRPRARRAAPAAIATVEHV